MKPLLTLLVACALLPNVALARSSERASKNYELKRVRNKPMSKEMQFFAQANASNRALFGRSQLPPGILDSKLPADVLKNYFPSEYNKTYGNHRQLAPNNDSSNLEVSEVVDTALTNTSSVIKEIKTISVKAQRELACLALNIYHEARGSTEEDRKSVAYVTVNRFRSGNFGKSICDVVTSPSQFSWVRQKHGSPTEEQAWLDAQRIAYNVFHNRISDPSKGSLFFWQPEKSGVKTWMASGTQYQRIGAHIYMR